MIFQLCYILELGSGSGLVGLASAMVANNSHIILTDLPVYTHNIKGITMVANNSHIILTDLPVYTHNIKGITMVANNSHIILTDLTDYKWYRRSKCKDKIKDSALQVYQSS